MKFIDVFCGTGGFHMGMESEGHECLYAVDYNKDAEIAYKSIWGEVEGWFEDVTDLDYTSLPDFDVLCGGFPCAKFSMAGDRKGFESDDKRAFMFFELMKIAKIKKPKYLFFENVKGLLSHDNGRSFATILHKMDELGYDAEWQVINAKDFGYPVLRERVFIIGHLRTTSTEKVFPIERGCKSYDCETSIYQFRRGNFRKFDGYCPTLTASMGTGGNNVPFIIKDNELRKLTPSEVFRLQGVKEDYIDKLINSGLPDSALYERAGRMVFIPIIKEIASRLK